MRKASFKRKNELKVPSAEYIKAEIRPALKNLEVCIDKNLLELFSYCFSKIDNYRYYNNQFVKILVDIVDWDKKKNKNLKKNLLDNLIKDIEKITNLTFPLIPISINLKAFTLLFTINQMITQYFRIENKLKNNKFKEAISVDIENLDKLFEIDSFKLDYETIFPKGIVKKEEDALNWLSNCIVRLKKYNPVVCSYKVQEAVNDDIRLMYLKTIKDFPFSEYVVNIFKEECNVIQQILTRIAVVNSYILELEKNMSFLKPLEYKKDLRHLKNTITRLNSLMIDIYGLMETGEYPEE